MKFLLRLIVVLMMVGSTYAQSNLPACPSSGYFHNCFGTFTLNNGGKYVGEVKDNKLHGQGTYTVANGTTYVGEFKDGKRNGQFTVNYANGNKYVGEFNNDVFNGQGTLNFANGNKYIGEFKDDKPNGQGTFTFVNGAKKVGKFKGDYNLNGQGTFTFVNGTKYVGELKDDKRNGQGTFYYANGGKYVGEWMDDEQGGEGIFYLANGSIYESGVWSGNNLVVAQYVDPKSFLSIEAAKEAEEKRIQEAKAAEEKLGQEAKAHSNLSACPSSGYFHNCFGAFTLNNGAKYVGEFKDNKFNGHGTYTFANSNKYVGEFKDGKYNGQGIFYLANGSISQSGIWSDNRLVTAQYVDPDEYQRNIAQRQESERKAEEDKRIQAEIEKKIQDREKQARIDRDRQEREAQEKQATMIMWNAYAQSDLPACPSSGYFHNCFGTFTYASGDKYIGEWKDGQGNGQGTYTYAGGNKYFGQYKDNKRNGQGIFYLANGSISQSGVWSDNSLVTAQYVDPNSFAEEKRIKKVKEAKEAEEKLIQEAKAAEERRIWLTTPAGKKFTSTAEAKVKEDEAERLRMIAVEEARAKKIQEEEDKKRLANKKKEEADYQKFVAEEIKAKKEQEKRQAWLASAEGKKYLADEEAKRINVEQNRMQAEAAKNARIAIAQSLNTDHEKGQFFAKCYAMGVMVMTSDSQASPSDIKKIEKWAMTISKASSTFISEKEFNSIVMTELKYIANTKGRLRSQALNCTSILGGW